MSLTWSQLSDLFLLFCLLGGFILIVYANAEYLPDDEREKNDEDWF